MGIPVRCEDCRFWDNSSHATEEDDNGVCRRHAPSAVDDRTGRAMWPYTRDNDWCAEGEPDPDLKKDPVDDLEDVLPF